MVSGQPGQTVCESPSQKKKLTKKDWWSAQGVVLSSSPSTAKINK
jgi:hypothetical protein